MRKSLRWILELSPPVMVSLLVYFETTLTEPEVSEFASSLANVTASFSAMILASLAVVAALLRDDMLDCLVRGSGKRSPIDGIGHPFIILSIVWAFAMFLLTSVGLLDLGLPVRKAAFSLGVGAGFYCLQTVPLMIWFCVNTLRQRADWVSALPHDSDSRTDVSEMVKEAKQCLDAGSAMGATSICLRVIQIVAEHLGAPNSLSLVESLIALDRSGLLGRAGRNVVDALREVTSMSGIENVSLLLAHKLYGATVAMIHSVGIRS